MNGSYEGGIGVQELAVENGGALYGFWSGVWWRWNGAGFVASSDPNMPPLSPPPPPASPPPPPPPPLVLGFGGPQVTIAMQEQPDHPNSFFN